MFSRILKAPGHYVARSLTQQLHVSQSLLQKNNFADGGTAGKPTKTQLLEEEAKEGITDTTLPVSQAESALDASARGPTTKVVEFHTPETKGRPLTETPEPVHVPTEEFHWEDQAELMQDMVIAEETFMDSLVFILI